MKGTLQVVSLYSDPNTIRVTKYRKVYYKCEGIVKTLLEFMRGLDSDDSA